MLEKENRKNQVNNMTFNSYQCRDCKRTEISHSNEHVRCENCGCKIFYKMRKNNYTQYEAR